VFVICVPSIGAPNKPNVGQLWLLEGRHEETHGGCGGRACGLGDVYDLTFKKRKSKKNKEKGKKKVFLFFF
jgi:hypothetical protein